MNTDLTPPKRPACPLCGKPSAHETHPFCSRRCAEVDLGRWLKGVYRLPSEETPDSEAGADDGQDGDDS